MAGYFKKGTQFLHALPICFGAFLAGCGGHAVNVLQPEPSAADYPGTSKVDMLVVTTRSSENAAPGEMFTGQRSFKTSFVDMEISIPPPQNRKIGDIQWPSKLPGNPETDFITLSADQMSYERALTKFDKKIIAAPGRRALVFVHGFNTNFEESVYRFAQIIYDSKAEAVPILFTWPSKGQLFAYNYDRESTTFSSDAFAEFLMRLAANKNVGEIDIMSHSMGNMAMLDAIHILGVKYGRLSPKIKQIIMAAPDVDVDIFQKGVNDIGNPHPPITLFVARNDRALAASQYIWEDHVRLGDINPEIEPYKSMLKKYGVTAIDLTNINTGDPVNHSKFAESPAIIKSIGSRLIDGQDMNSHTPQFGETISSTVSGGVGAVGGAAAALAHGPGALVDENSRAVFTHHMNHTINQFQSMPQNVQGIGATVGQ